MFFVGLPPGRGDGRHDRAGHSHVDGDVQPWLAGQLRHRDRRTCKGDVLEKKGTVLEQESLPFLDVLLSVAPDRSRTSTASSSSSSEAPAAVGSSMSLVTVSTASSPRPPYTSPDQVLERLAVGSPPPPNEPPPPLPPGARFFLSPPFGSGSMADLTWPAGTASGAVRPPMCWKARRKELASGPADMTVAGRQYDAPGGTARTSSPGPPAKGACAADSNRESF